MDLIPHIATVYLKVEYMEVLPGGEASGEPVDIQRRLLAIKGDSLEDCKNKVNNIVEVINGTHKR